jgi:hypothetical protein
MWLEVTAKLVLRMRATYMSILSHCGCIALDNAFGADGCAESDVEEFVELVVEACEELIEL